MTNAPSSETKPAPDPQAGGDAAYAAKLEQYASGLEQQAAALEKELAEPETEAQTVARVIRDQDALKRAEHARILGILHPPSEPTSPGGGEG